MENQKKILKKIEQIKNEIETLQEEKKRDFDFFFKIKNQYEPEGENHEIISMRSWQDDEIETLQKKLKQLEKKLKN